MSRLRNGALWGLLLAGSPALALPPDEASAIELHRRGKQDEARALLVRRLELPGLDAEALVGLAASLQKIGAPDQVALAERALRAALAARPHYVPAVLALGELYREHEARFAKQDFLRELYLRTLDQRGLPARERAALELGLAELEAAWGRLDEARARLAALARSAPPRQIAAAIGLSEERIERLAAAQVLRRWPDENARPEERAWLAAAEEQHRHRADTEALATVDRLLGARPAWQAALSLRGRVLEGLQRYDDAARTFESLLRLQPADARAQRRLGLLLQQHGGALGVAAADEALRRALALEPGYVDLWLRRAELLVGRGDAREARQALDRFLQLRPAARNDEGVRRLERAIDSLDRKGLDDLPRLLAPPEALARFAEVESWLELGDPGGIGRRLLDEVVKQWPEFVPAQALRYGLTGEAPTEAERALWSNPDGLFELAVRCLGATTTVDAQTSKLTARWLDRAIALGHREALYRRALLARVQRDDAQASALLLRYLAQPERPQHVTEAQALRQRLFPDEHSDGAERLLRLAQLRLGSERPQTAEALALLGNDCAAAPVERRLGLGLVLEHAGAVERAAACYASLLGQSPAPPAAIERLAQLVLEEPRLASPALRQHLVAAAPSSPLAALAEAACQEASGDDRQAATAVRRFLDASDEDAVGRSGALRLLERLEARRRQRAAEELEAARRRRDRWEMGLFAGLVVSMGSALWIAGTRRRSVLAALRHRPALYPTVVEAVGAIRHDLLKHRTSALSLVEGTPAAELPALRGNLAASILEPSPTTQLVKQVYKSLEAAATGLGVPLVRPERDPSFGPLLADLRRCEELLSPTRSNAPLDGLVAIDRRLRGEHDRALGQLLAAGPRTTLELATVSRWIAAVRAELEPSSSIEPVVTAPPEVAFPIEEAALFAIFSNLLRNALVASRQSAQPAVAIRLGSERDPTGRRELVLAVLDSGETPLPPSTLEASAPDRGLGIVRDTAARWRARLRIEPLPPGGGGPYRKSLQVRFAA